jgi:hypothetical protein
LKKHFPSPDNIIPNSVSATGGTIFYDKWYKHRYMTPNKADNSGQKKAEQHPPTKGNENARQPDPETLGTTDPEEHMEGPISSLVQKVKKGVEKNGNEDAEKAEK